MAEKGAFPEDVTLDALDYVKDGEVVSTMKSGEMLEVRLQFSGALQEYLDSASPRLLWKPLQRRSVHFTKLQA